MGSIAAEEIRSFFRALSERYPHPARIYLLGGSALCLLGNPRRTADIDYTLEETSEYTEELHRAIDLLANEAKLELEVVAIQEFIPLPTGSHTRHQKVDQFGKLEIFVFDPYSIAISKLGRGFEADLQDVLYIQEQEYINLDDLAAYVEEAKVSAWDFDIDPEELQLRLNDIRRLMK